MQKVSPSVANDVRSLDREERSGDAAKVNWHGRERSMPSPSWRRFPAPVGVVAYFNGDEDFNLKFSGGGAEFSVWTTSEGLEAVIASCQAALVRARIQRESVA